MHRIHHTERYVVMCFPTRRYWVYLLDFLFLSVSSTKLLLRVGWEHIIYRMNQCSCTETKFVAFCVGSILVPMHHSLDSMYRTQSMRVLYTFLCPIALLACSDGNANSRLKTEIKNACALSLDLSSSFWMHGYLMSFCLRRCRRLSDMLHISALCWFIVSCVFRLLKDVPVLGIGRNDWLCRCCLILPKLLRCGILVPLYTLSGWFYVRV